MVKHHVVGFMEFIRGQGVMGLAVAFVLGGAVTKLVTTIVTDVVNPLLGLLLGRTGGLQDAIWMVGGAEIKIGHLTSALIDFFVIALLIYSVVKIVGVEGKK
ncbi:hypothetical protein A3A70_00410 [candidate division WWE3 bacterium RIFCSPLOWO2_01_FULL_42_11]|uniref:Mechanosensitive ion channel protein MscL n=1 Tax=candidate division WWE3 bacterium RIFCSPLOWO2_01_FULL_42_11 TaxID=1802627 RepID=A0A1F4VN02_UNCKA|nr:MAG: hypothetical protein A3A70_00410 [candidate division WWE3 bacterium RIFCSPLOWO2_01_FULL_42_11]